MYTCMFCTISVASLDLVNIHPNIFVISNAKNSLLLIVFIILCKFANVYFMLIMLLAVSAVRQQELLIYHLLRNKETYLSRVSF